MQEDDDRHHGREQHADHVDDTEQQRGYRDQRDYVADDNHVDRAGISDEMIQEQREEDEEEEFDRVMERDRGAKGEHKSGDGGEKEQDEDAPRIMLHNDGDGQRVESEDGNFDRSEDLPTNRNDHEQGSEGGEHPSESPRSAAAGEEDIDGNGRSGSAEDEGEIREEPDKDAAGGGDERDDVRQDGPESDQPDR